MLLRPAEDDLARRRRDLADAEAKHAENRLVCGRDYFFALYGRGSLQRLMDALPALSDFRV